MIKFDKAPHLFKKELAFRFIFSALIDSHLSEQALRYRCFSLASDRQERRQIPDTHLLRHHGTTIHSCHCRTSQNVQEYLHTLLRWHNLQNNGTRPQKCAGSNRPTSLLCSSQLSRPANRYGGAPIVIRCAREGVTPHVPRELSSAGRPSREARSRSWSRLERRGRPPAPCQRREASGRCRRR